MNLTFSKTVRCCLLSVAAVILPATLTADQVREQRGVWTAVGATATVDESSVRNVVMHSSGSIALTPNLPRGTAVVRFNVPPSPNLHDWRLPEHDFGLDTTFYALIRDNGRAARVILKLQEMDDTTGAIRTVGMIDSDALRVAFEPSSNYVMLEGSLILGAFDFLSKSYFIEATLTKTAKSGNPGIKLVKIQQFP